MAGNVVPFLSSLNLQFVLLVIPAFFRDLYIDEIDLSD